MTPDAMRCRSLQSYLCPESTEGQLSLIRLYGAEPATRACQNLVDRFCALGEPAKVIRIAVLFDPA